MEAPTATPPPGGSGFAYGPASVGALQPMHHGSSGASALRTHPNPPIPPKGVPCANQGAPRHGRGSAALRRGLDPGFGRTLGCDHRGLRFGVGSLPSESLRHLTLLAEPGQVLVPACLVPPPLGAVEVDPGDTLIPHWGRATARAGPVVVRPGVSTWLTFHGMLALASLSVRTLGLRFAPGQAMEAPEHDAGASVTSWGGS